MRFPAAVRRIVALVAVALLASGCLRFRGDLSVSADERVSGTLVIALKTTDQPTEDDLGSGDLPADLQDKVSIEPYDQDGYQGSTLTLKGLTFAELDRPFQGTPDQVAVSGQPSPGATTSPPQGVPTTSLSMRRDGDRVVMTGQFFFDVVLRRHRPGRRVRGADADHVPR